MIQLSLHSTINRSITYNYSSDHDDDDDGGAEAGLLAAAALRRVPHVHGVRHATQQQVVAGTAMDAVVTIAAAQQIVGPDLHVTGGPFAYSLMLSFA
jgi:hypothetical protein